MKKHYWKNLLLSHLNPNTAIEVFRAFMGKPDDVKLLNEIVSVLRREDLDEFLVLLKKTTYNPEETAILTLILKYPMKKSTYKLFRSLGLNKRCILNSGITGLRDSGCNNEEFLLNYCFIREMLGNYSTFELFSGVNLSLFQPKVRFKLEDFDDSNTTEREYSENRYFHILKEMIFSLVISGKGTAVLKESGASSNALTVESLRKQLKEPLLIAILDQNGRVNADEYSPDDLLLVYSNQIYNISEKEKTLQDLCRSSTNHLSLCMWCSKKCRETSPRWEASGGSFHSSVAALKNTTKDRDIHGLFEEAILEGNITLVYTVLLHSPSLRLPKYLKLLLKLYISKSAKLFKIRNENESRLVDLCIGIFGLFEMDEENETVAISFFKASEAYLYSAIKALPCFMKTKKLYFAGFITLLQAYRNSSVFVRLVSKNIIQRFNKEFNLAMDLILEYYILKVSHGSVVNATASALMDKEFLYDRLSLVADMFSLSAEAFVSRNIYHIFNIFYPSPNFTQSFVENNIKFAVIQRIIYQSYSEQVDDVDILVGLMFQDYFSNLNRFFKPSISLFVKKNLSHILFKIKSAYTQDIYNKRTCIYKIMKFVLEQVNLSLYFSYVWPYVEFFLNNEYCVCAGYFLEWLRAFQDSRLMCPYLIIPFEKIEDIPLIPNLEVKIYEMLARYFSDDKKPFKYRVCPFDTAQRGRGSGGQGNDNNERETTNDDGQFVFSALNNGLNIGLLALYKSIRDCAPQYATPKEQANQPFFISDRVFIKKFLLFYQKSKTFRSLIHSLKPSSLPVHTKALFGDIRYNHTNYDTTKQNSTLNLSDISDIPRIILENFLLKINYERQDLFAFTIQEFLKSIKGGFDPETENFIQQFRHTKFEYKFTLKQAKEIDLSSYRSFLESVFSVLYFKTKKFQFMKYLVLFDDCTLEFSCLCLIKIILYDTDGANINKCSENKGEGSDVIDGGIASKDDLCNIFNDVATSNSDILKFLLKINAFIGQPIVNRKSCLDYALRARDYYSLIYCLEDRETDSELLQIAYYMINDVVRVKGFNIKASMHASSQVPGIQNGEYSTLNLFFDFILGKNYKAALQCLNDLSSNAGTVNSTVNSSVRSFDRLLSNLEPRSTSQKDIFVSRILKEILECNESEEVENILLGKDPDIIIHVLKDIELLLSTCSTSGVFNSSLEPCSEDPANGSIAVGNSTADTVRLIEKRRKISRNPDLLLKVHKYLESKINCEEFSKSVDLELIECLIKKKEFQKAEEEIARMVLRKEYSVLYDHSLIKIEQKHQSEAKELLRRMRLQCPEDSIDYFRATVKLCEIGQSKSVFEEGISDLERILNDKINSYDGIGDKFGMTKVDEDTSGNIAFVSNGGLNNSTGRKKSKSVSIINLAYEKLKASSASASIDVQNMSEFLGYVQRLYFLTAKYFERHDALVSIKYYFKSFTSNHEAIPRFFHLIANVPRVHMKIVGEMIEAVKKEYLPNLIPFYNQISTKLSLETETVKFYKEIVSTMLEKYPYQTHWNTLFLFNSKKTEVSKVLMEIIESLSLERRKLFMDIKNCSEKFTGIAKHNGTKLSMENFPDTRSLFPAKINVPGQLTEINNIKNDIVVFRSLQTPKKITLVGEDGREYPMIVKFKDDLRKDSRFMDLDNLLNKLFISDEYYIRKYNVIPFNHESGIIEFVPNLCNLKEIVHSYHEITHETVQKFLRTKMIGANNMIPLMEKFRPVYNRYLKETYTDPFQFYRCRENYIRTYAIMNIVGWFMGLGDRHSENIHFDKTTGDTVHVDLNCIFNKAKSLEIPEKVPFRLTQNIIDGFGVLRLEGTYKHTLKHTLEVLRDNRDVIQANLLSFVFDPLFEWARKKTEPAKIIEGMNKKLDFEDVDFKIEELIGEATDINNLGSMYIGWMAFV